MSKLTNMAGKIKGFFKDTSAPAPDDDTTLPEPAKASPERPILEASQDALERGRFVERLASALIGRNTAQATGIVLGSHSREIPASGASALRPLAHFWAQ